MFPFISLKTLVTTQEIFIWKGLARWPDKSHFILQLRKQSKFPPHLIKQTQPSSCDSCLQMITPSEESLCDHRKYNLLQNMKSLHCWAGPTGIKYMSMRRKVHECSKKHYWWWPKEWKQPKHPQLRNVQTKSGMSIQWNITWPWKRTKQWFRWLYECVFKKNTVQYVTDVHLCHHVDPPTNGGRLILNLLTACSHVPYAILSDLLGRGCF